MGGTSALVLPLVPKTAAKGYFVHARYESEQLMTPEAGMYYVELETALALGLAWVNERHAIDPQALLVSTVRRRDRQIAAMAIRFRGVPRCGVLVARSEFEPARREKPVQKHQGWWKKFSR